MLKLVLFAILMSKNSQNDVRNVVKICIQAIWVLNFMISLSKLGIYIEKIIGMFLFLPTVHAKKHRELWKLIVSLVLSKYFQLKSVCYGIIHFKFIDKIRLHKMQKKLRGMKIYYWIGFVTLFSTKFSIIRKNNVLSANKRSGK